MYPCFIAGGLLARIDFCSRSHDGIMWASLVVFLTTLLFLDSGIYTESTGTFNAAREVADRIQQETGRKLSVASVKKVLHNAALYQHIREFFEGQKSDDAKNNFVLREAILPNLLFFGVRDSV